MLDDKTANAGSGNYTKYARDLDAVTDFYNGAKNGYAWCDVFVDWCFYKAFGAEMAKKLLCQPDKSAGAGCTYSLAYYNAKGQFHRDKPQPGDQIFFGSVGNSNHTGLVTEVKDGWVYTVEGNSSDGVCERLYAPWAYNIAGYGRPDWSLVSGDYSADEPYVEDDPYADGADTQGAGEELRDLYSGCIGEDVRGIQILLIGRGYSCGPDGADGDFGVNTKNAVLKYQQLHELEDDGIVGVNTRTCLLSKK